MASSNLTAREQDVLRAVAQVGTVTVDDWDKVATLANMKTGKYARDTWGGVRKKLTAGDTTKGAKATNGDAGDGENGVGGNATPGGKAKKTSTPKSTPRKRKKDDADDEESPKKKTPKTKKSTEKVKESEDEDSAVKAEPNEAGELMDDMGVR